MRQRWGERGPGAWVGFHLPETFGITDALFCFAA